MANEEDLVSQVAIEGADTAAAELQAYAAAGQAAFDKLAASAKAAGVTIQGSSAGVDKFKTSLGQAATASKDASDQIQAIKPVPAATAKSLKDVENAAASFTASLKPLTQGIGRFVSRVALLTTGAAAAGTAFAAMAVKVAKGTVETASSLKVQTDAQIAANDAAGAAQTAAIGVASSIRGLQKQAMAGEISWLDYTKAVKKVNDDAREQQRVAIETANVQARVKDANDRLQKSLANQEAQAKLINTFGGPLVTALTAFGNAIEVVRKDFVASFGPGASTLIDTITTTLSKNAAAIGNFFSAAGTKLTAFMTNNAPAIEKALENIGSAASGIFDGVLAAGPSLLAFFNDTLVPAIKTVVSWFDNIAKAINFAFGTNVTGGFLIMLVLLAQLSGAFKLFFAVLKTGAALFNALRLAALAAQIPFAPFLIIIGLVTYALFLLATQVDWAAVGLKIAQFVNAVVAKWTELKTNTAALKDSIVQAWNDAIAYLLAIPGKIGTMFQTLWDGAKQLATDAALWVQAKFQALIDWFASLPATISQFFVDLWETVKTATANAFDSLKSTVKAWVDSVLGWLKPILDGIAKVNAAASSGGGGDVQGQVRAAGGGHILGPGTSTSDSIAAWLSNNEYVVKAKSVAKYGVGFMNAINSGRFRMPKFSGGGLNIISSAPRTHYADGGPVQTGGNMRPLSLSLFGEQFDGLMMPENVADRMTKFAIGRQTRSAGRKPSWIAGTR